MAQLKPILVLNGSLLSHVLIVTKKKKPYSQLDVTFKFSQSTPILRANKYC